MRGCLRSRPFSPTLGRPRPWSLPSSLAKTFEQNCPERSSLRTEATEIKKKITALSKGSITAILGLILRLSEGLTLHCKSFVPFYPFCRYIVTSPNHNIWDISPTKKGYRSYIIYRSYLFSDSRAIFFYFLLAPNTNT